MIRSWNDHAVWPHGGDDVRITRVLDVILEEDDRPWTRHPHGMVIVKLLRRMAFNLLSLFRGVYLRSDENRAMPWRKVIAPFYDALRMAEENDLLRGRDLARRIRKAA